MSLGVVATQIHTTIRDGDAMERAWAIAQAGENKVRVGAVLKKGRITLAEAYNKHRNPVENVEYGDATVHAEAAVLKHAKRGSTLYVGRLGVIGVPLPSHPCSTCMGLIEKSEVSKLVFLDESGKLVKVRLGRARRGGCKKKS